MLMTIGGNAPLASSGCTIDSPSLTVSCTLRNGVGDDGVAGGLARDVERLQNRNAAGHERAEGRAKREIEVLRVRSPKSGARSLTRSMTMRPVGVRATTL